MPNKKCPCIDCICKPICRHKIYDDLFSDCYMVFDYGDKAAFFGIILFTDITNNKELIKIYEELNPTKWEYVYTGEQKGLFKHE